MNKKAWIRIAEASIAIILIMGVILLLLSNQPILNNNTDEIYKVQTSILNLIVEDNQLREEILNGNKAPINQKISEIIPANWEFETNICNIDSVCPNPETILEKQVYTTERLVTSTLTTYNPKKIRFFVWMK